MSSLDLLVRSDHFIAATKAEQSEMVTWLLYRNSGAQAGVTLGEVANSFAFLELVKPNVTRIKSHFRSSKNIRSLGRERYAPTREFSSFMEDQLPQAENLSPDVLDLDSITLPPFVSGDRKADLGKMVRAYAQLFLLENSMRGLVEKVLGDNLGTGWWDAAANASMKKKHSDRVQNESVKKWAPTRGDFGPLYALDWSDLITLMRKYPQYFEKYVKDINFLHRYDDAGTYRNVVAHNGVLREDDDFNIIRIYYRDWIKQLS